MKRSDRLQQIANDTRIEVSKITELHYPPVFDNIDTGIIKPIFKVINGKVTWRNLCETLNVRYYKRNKFDDQDIFVISLIDKNLNILDICCLRELCKNESPIIIPIIKKILIKLNDDVNYWYWQDMAGPDVLNVMTKQLKQDCCDRLEGKYNKLLNLVTDPLSVYYFNCSIIFELDKVAMRKQMQPFAEELIAAVLHPRRVGRILEEHDYNISTDEYWHNY